eukprot:CCRYP_002056-RA/>CCRYP_002056-RA protein AED:0.33 eAED:0.33 QI:0/0/0/1/0/0/3/0/485
MRKCGKQVTQMSYADSHKAYTTSPEPTPCFSSTNMKFTDRLKGVTFGKIVTDYHPQKVEPNRTHLTVVGTYIDYPWDVATPTSDLSMAKLLFNSVISTLGATFLGMDLKNFYLNTPMDHLEYMKLKLALITAEIVEKHNLSAKQHNRWVSIQIDLGMYGLPQASILANKLLVKRLAQVGYHPCQFTPGLWRHVWQPVTFCLVVDDFSIKTVGLHHAKHLKEALEKNYKVMVDWKGELFCGVNLKWDYTQRTVDLSMPMYTPAALHRPNQILLYFGQAVDPTLAAALSSISSRQAKGTTAVIDACHQLLDYCTTHPNPSIHYLASDMVLALDTNRSYLSELNGKSRAAAYIYLTRKDNPDFHNGAITVLSAIIKHVMASALEMELVAFGHTALSSPQGNGPPAIRPHPVTTDNFTAVGLTQKTTTPKALKSMDMRFHWLRSWREQQLFTFLWAKGINNRADYPSMHPPPKYHTGIHSRYVHEPPAE